MAVRFGLGLASMIWAISARGADGRDDGPSAVFRLVHPDHQAAAVLKLFEGSRAPHPAAALAAWKRATREPNRLGKSTEAVISFFNPEMIPEWKVLHGAECRLGIDPDKGTRLWSLVVPGDDGTFAALITALRLTGGDQEAPAADGKPAVERLGGPGAAVGTRRGPGREVTLASSRAALEQAVPRPADLLPLAGALESGLVFRVDPGRHGQPASAGLTMRRAVELARGLGCRAALGSLGLSGDRLAIEVETELDPGHAVSRPGLDTSAIEPAWLSWIPAEEVAACACLALGRGPGFWDGAFDVADRVDRADPARADLAPLRTRLNLLATMAGVRLEADLWPHLRGATFALLTDPANPGRAGRALLALHLDENSAARRLADEVAPRLSGLAGGLKKAARPTSGTQGPKGVPIDPSASRPLGRFGGRPLEVVIRDRTVLIGWGEGALGAALRAGERHEGSVATLMAISETLPGSRPPGRVAALWPGRMPIPVKGLDGLTPLARALAQGPPITWVGWNHADRAADRISWPGLSATIRRFLEAIPLDAMSDMR
jgi:hypothetical protein